MILGIGVDVVEVQSFRKRMEDSGDRFVKRIFTAGEIRYCRSRPQAHESFAVRFAAKEAAMKALGLAGVSGLEWRHVEVVSDSSERPALTLHGIAARRSARLHVHRLLVSLSHSANVATAIVLAEHYDSGRSQRRSRGQGPKS